MDAGELAAEIEGATDAAALRLLYDRAPDPDLRCNAVCRALTIDARAGVLLALDFLERDPPLFFRQPALDALTAVELRARDFQVSTSFGTEPNRSLLRTLRRERERGDAKTR